MRVGIDFDMSKRKFVDVQTIFHKMEQRHPICSYHFYCGKCLEDAHTAAADTMATYEVLKAQLDKYGDKLENNIGFLSEFSAQNKNVDFAGFIIYDEKGVEVFNFGKNKGIPVEKVLREQQGYYDWMMKSDFSAFILKKC